MFDMRWRGKLSWESWWRKKTISDDDSSRCWDHDKTTQHSKDCCPTTPSSVIDWRQRLIPMTLFSSLNQISMHSLDRVMFGLRVKLTLSICFCRYKSNVLKWCRQFFIFQPEFLVKKKKKCINRRSYQLQFVVIKRVYPMKVSNRCMKWKESRSYEIRILTSNRFTTNE